MFAFFVALGLALAAAGVYGMVATIVGQARREIAVRMALGVRRGHMSRFLAAKGLVPTLLGIGIRLVGDWMIGRGLADNLRGVGPADPAILVAVPLLLAATVLAASYGPLRQALALDPVSAPRAE